jgi:hypothetical protein
MSQSFRRIACIVMICAWQSVLGQSVYPGKFDIDKADSVAALFSGYPLTDLRELSYNLTNPLPTDAEKFRAIYTWVCMNISNDYGLFEENRLNLMKYQDQQDQREAWLKSFSPRVFKTLVTKRSTICTGYAYLIKELAYHAGIESQIVHGYGRSSGANIGGPGIINHSWNAVKLEGSWYLCDPTWSSGGVDPGAGLFIPDYANDVYFLADPSLFILNHYPQDTIWTLLENAPSLSEFLNSPVVYKKAYGYDAAPAFPENLLVKASQGDTLSFYFTLNSIIPDKIAVQYGKYSRRKVVVPEYIQETRLYRIRYPLKGKRNKVLHILMADQYVWSYHVLIKN